MLNSRTSGFLEKRRADISRVFARNPGIDRTLGRTRDSNRGFRLAACRVLAYDFSPSKERADPYEAPGKASRALQRNRGKGGSATPRTRSEGQFGNQGFFSLASSIALLVLFGGAGLLTMMRNIRDIAERQVALDRCAGSQALALRGLMEQFAATRRRLEEARLRTIPDLATTSEHEALEVFRTVARAESRVEMGIRIRWQKIRRQWLENPGLGCGLHHHPHRSPYPESPPPSRAEFLTVPELASQSLLMRGPGEVRLWIQSAKLLTEATLTGSPPEGWHAEWTR